MTRLYSAICLFVLWTLPLDAAAYWFGPADGQCAVAVFDAVDFTVDASEPEGDCESSDLDDPSSNACFEGAEHPISTLPALIAENFAQRATAHVVRQAAQMLQAPAPLPSPNEASVEDPVLPGTPLVKLTIPAPRQPNACSVYPDECKTAPWVPSMNFEGSVSPALQAHEAFGFPPTPELADSRRGPPNSGPAPADGIRQRVERPPRFA